MTTGLLLAVIIVIAVALWLVPGIDPTLRKLLIAVAVIVFLVWLLWLFGVWGGETRTIRIN